MIKHGYAFPGEGFVEDQNLPTLVTPGNFARTGGFKAAKTKTFRGDFPAEYCLQAGDLIVSMTDLSKEGATLGLPAIVPDDRVYLHNQRIGLVQVMNPQRVDRTFLNYLFRTDKYRAHVLGTASGSTVRHTSPSRIYDYVAEVPNVHKQRAIAEVLRALDDKVAANARLASTAVELADSLFAMRVRGIQPSQTFAEVAVVKGGGTPSTKVEEYWSGSVHWATPTDVTNLSVPYLESTGRLITDDGLAACASELHPEGSILMTSRATIGAFAIAQVPMAVNQGFIVVNAHDPEAQWWLFHEMRSRVPEFLSHANGATFLELSRGRFKALQVRLPDPPAYKDFAATIDPLHERARAASRESSELATIRDTLLPQLMSGKIRVRDAVRVVEGVV
ncbi:restriction endonuclease subunit S [Humibacillus xanthopallidus]|nr:restriction endonuclease subunit S [Humibacillus xanthopallidus]